MSLPKAQERFYRRFCHPQAQEALSRVGDTLQKGFGVVSPQQTGKDWLVQGRRMDTSSSWTQVRRKTRKARLPAE